MKKLIAIFLLLAAAGGGTWYYYNYGRPKERPQVVTAAVSRQNIVEVVQATGSLEATRLVPVGSQVSGTVAELFADYNSIVKKDQIIAKLDPALLQTKVAIAEANIERAQNDIEQQKVQLANDELNLARTKAQFDQQMVSKQQLEQADLTVKSRKATIASNEKGILQQKATLDEAKLNVKYCTIISPVDGVVVERKVDIGQAVQSSVNVAQFFTIATDLTSLRLTAGVDEADIGKVHMGMPVTFTVEAYGQQTFTGTVEAVRLNATTNQSVVTYPVWIKVPNDQLKLKPSMTASIKIIISTAEDALRVPNGALRFKPNKDIYAALGIPEQDPTNGAGGRNRGAGNAANQPGADGRPGGGGANAQQPAGQTPATPNAAPGAGAPDRNAQQGPRNQMAGNQGSQAGQGGQGGGRGNGGNGGRGGFGGGGGGNGRQRPQGGFGSGNMNLTPDQLARFQAGRGGNQGAGGGRNGGRGGGRNQQPGNAVVDTTPLTERNATKIDELLPDVPHMSQPGQVYTWDEAKKELKMIRVTVGVTDGQFSELVGGDLKEGTNLVTSVIIPQVVKPGQMNNQNPFMGGQGGRGMNPGGMQPGGGGPGGGGGGGGRGGGGGGGGRGGGN